MGRNKGGKGRRGGRDVKILNWAVREGLAGKATFGQRPEGGERGSEPCSFRPFGGTVFRPAGTASAKTLRQGATRSWVLLVCEGEEARSGHRGLVAQLRRLDFIMRVTESHGRACSKADWRLDLGCEKLPLASLGGAGGTGKHVNGGSGREGLSWR